MRNRPLKMDAWGIGFDEYKELYHFCQQYERKKRQLADMLTLPSSMPEVAVGGDGGAGFMPHAHGGASDPVGAVVVRRERYHRDLRMIEQAAIATDSELYPYILKAVTTRDSARSIHPPCGDRQFRDARRQFFYTLWCAKNDETKNRTFMGHTSVL